MDSKLAPEKRFALLIDSDNVSSKYIKLIINELSKYGTITYKRCYGDWTQTLHSKWKESLLENSITPIQQFAYTTGKNATDSAMIIDAMDILYTNTVEGFCIVSSDSDFTRLASRIRESGVRVIGMGEKKTPLAFRKACDIFTTLELLESVDDSSRGSAELYGAQNASAQGTGPSKEKVEREVRSVVTDNLNSGRTTSMGEVGQRLVKRYPDFDVRSYGTNQLSKLLGEFGSIRVVKMGKNLSVELVEGKEGSKLSPKKKVADKKKKISKHNKEKLNEREHDVSAVINSNREQVVQQHEHKASDSLVVKATDSLNNASVVPMEDIMQQVAPFVVSEIASAGKQGITVGELSNRTRRMFKMFKVRDTGFTSFRSYLKTMPEVLVEKKGSEFIVRIAE